MVCFGCTDQRRAAAVAAGSSRRPLSSVASDELQVEDDVGEFSATNTGEDLAARSEFDDPDAANDDEDDEELQAVGEDDNEIDVELQLSEPDELGASTEHEQPVVGDELPTQIGRLPAAAVRAAASIEPVAQAQALQVAPATRPSVSRSMAVCNCTYE